jgi:hypothetical protein
MPGRAKFPPAAMINDAAAKRPPAKSLERVDLLETALELQIDAHPQGRSNASSSVHDCSRHGPVSPCKFSLWIPRVAPWLIAGCLDLRRLLEGGCEAAAKERNSATISSGASSCHILNRAKWRHWSQR